MAAKFDAERGGVRRYLDIVKPEEYRPEIGEVNLSELSLTGLADLYGSDKGNIKHNYTRIYERLINDLGRDKDLWIGEFGVACGASLRMWANYVPNATIVAWDIRPECATLCADLDSVSILTGDPAKAPGAKGQYDLIIDDASHIAEEIVAAFRNCWDWVKPDGYYVIEDLGCTYSPGYTQQFREHFDATAKNDRGNLVSLVDALMKVCDQKGSVAEFHYYPQLLVIKRK